MLSPAPPDADSPPAAAQGAAWSRICIALSLGTLLLPALLAAVPPLMDYPNHLARMWLIAGGAADPQAGRFYLLDWAGTSTNLGLDLVAAALGRGLPLDAMGRLVVAAALVLPPLGAVLLNRAAFGGWHWWQAGFALLAWNSTLLAGFLNFQIGLGLALLAAAAMPALRRHAGLRGMLAAQTLLGGALLVWHIFAAMFHAALVAGLVFGTTWPRRRADLTAALGRAGLAGGLVLGLPLGLYLLGAPATPLGRVPDGVLEPAAGYTVAVKATTLLSALLTYDIAFDFALLGGALALLLTARQRVHAGLALAAAGLTGLALAIPHNLASTAFVDWRFPAMALLTAAAAAQPEVPRQRQAGLAAAALLALALFRTGWIGAIWHERNADIAALRQVLQALPRGAALLPVTQQASPDASMPRGRLTQLGMPGYAHQPALAVPWRGAFVPTLFAAPGMQPLRVRAPWSVMAASQGELLTLALLDAPRPTLRERFLFGYADHWRTRFDHLLLINADLPPSPGDAIPAELELLADAGFARLYRIPRPGP